jgi:AcrR family transcriptional regulator
VLDASLQLIDEQGMDALSLREVARRAGVTHGAPYHHFHDKAELLDAVAEEGFGLLRDQMQAARAGLTHAGQRLAATGQAYVRFALSHSAHFQVMFRPGRTAPVRRGETSAQAFDVLVDAVDECQRAGLAPQGDPERIVLLAWSAVHGLASLWLDGALVRPGAGPRVVESAGEEITRLLADLLAAAGPGRRRAARRRGGAI